MLHLSSESLDFLSLKSFFIRTNVHCSFFSMKISFLKTVWVKQPVLSLHRPFQGGMVAHLWLYISIFMEERNVKHHISLNKMNVYSRNDMLKTLLSLHSHTSRWCQCSVDQMFLSLKGKWTKYVAFYVFCCGHYKDAKLKQTFLTLRKYYLLNSCLRSAHLNKTC